MNVVDLTPTFSDAPSAVIVSIWDGEDTIEVPADPADRRESVWVDGTRLTPLSADAVSSSDFVSLLTALSEEERLSVAHEQDDFVTEWSGIRRGAAWGRIRRYAEAAIAPDPAISCVYEDAIAVGLPPPRRPSSSGAATKDGGGEGGNNRLVAPLVSVLAVQQSVNAAKSGAWVRVVGVVKHANVSFGFVQEYDGTGCVVALRGGELRPLFVVEVVVGFSDASLRGSHRMWIQARYKKFRHRFATWSVPNVDGLGPKAEPFHENLRESLTNMGYPDAGDSLARQLERVMRGFAAASDRTLLDDAKVAADASADATSELLSKDE